jgi:hypothetical protein
MSLGEAKRTFTLRPGLTFLKVAAQSRNGCANRQPSVLAEENGRWPLTKPRKSQGLAPLRTGAMRGAKRCGKSTRRGLSGEVGLSCAGG